MSKPVPGSRGSGDERPATAGETVQEKINHKGTTASSPETPKSSEKTATATDSDGPVLPVDPFAHLPDFQADILRRQAQIPDAKKGVAVLYRYTSRNDLLIMIVCGICAAASGAALPSMTIVFGGLQGIFEDYFNGNTTFGHFQDKMGEYVLYFVYLGIGQFAVTYISTVGYIYVGEHITGKIRKNYLQSCLRQNIGFFDNIGAGEVTTRLTADMNLIQDGISEKVSLSISSLSTFIAAFIIGFVNSWKLTLILSCIVVAWMVNMGVCTKFMLGNMNQSLESYGQGGNLADEVFSSIRNAVAFGTQSRLSDQYDVHLAKAEYYGFRFKSATGLIMAGLQAILYLGYGLAFWQGSKFLTQGEMPLSQLLIVMMSVMTGAFVLGNVAPNMQAFMTAVAAGGKIFNTIDRSSPIDAEDDAGDKPDTVVGNLRLENIHHIYPSRPEVVVMKDVSIDVPAGKTTALVGPSGSGKSTIVGLVERFYDPVGGKVYLDGHDISKLNVGWLRQQIAMVSQEPVLFGTTIFENIRHGLLGSRFEHDNEETQRARVLDAAKQANAHDFISELIDGYETNVGQRGFLLSGGQKQRIAIARAIVSDPKILLLDEATSALDSKSEGVVQEALNVAAQGRTTIIIAHRLYTIKDADNIVVMADGAVVEQGTHSQLLSKNGAYSGLVAAQSLVQDGDDTNEVEKRLSYISSHGDGIIKIPTEVAGDDGQQLNQNRLSKTKSAGGWTLPEQDDTKQSKTSYGLWTLIKFIISFNAADWKMMTAGCLFSLLCGLGNPVTALFFAKQITTLSRPMPQNDPADVKSDSDFWSAMYVMLAFVLCIAYGGQGIAFAKTSERLVYKVRDTAFRTLLRQDVEFFDREENSTGALTSFLSTETTHVAGLSGVTLGGIIVAVSTLVSCCALGLAIGWKLSLVCIATLPVTITCGFFHFWSLTHFQQRSKVAYESSAGFASEAVAAIRTIASLHREDHVLSQYRDSLNAQERRSLITVLKTTLLFAASQSMVFLCFGLCFWFGGTLIGRGEYIMFQFFLCFMAILFGAQNVAIIFAFAPDMGKAHSAAQALKTLMDREPTIDTWKATGETIQQINGAIEFRDVHFKYPTRPEQRVLQGLSLSIKSGQYVALVGASGCGKSTLIALLERFYDLSSGSILVDGHSVDKLNINNYRSHIALVSQEPTLYQGTIRENILLGSPDKEAPDEVIEAAARKANILDFITSLPEGFNTVVGNKGSLLSGGQKQRIAIARALIRDPKILLLDEATSALDSESEHIVQAALDAAAEGRTTIAIAHRLSTVRKADVIFFLDKGQVVESGSHSELMRKKGRYAELVSLQTLDKQ